MATPTYDLLDSTTLSSSASSVTFTSIDQSYRDLVLVVEGKFTSNDYLKWNYNSYTSGVTYNQVTMSGNGSNTYSSSNGLSDGHRQTLNFQALSSSNSTWILQIFDYSTTDKHKSALMRFDQASNVTNATAYRWAQTTAITSIQFSTNSGANWAANSTFYLYGISA